MKINIKKLILLLITCVFLYFVFVNINFKEFLNAFKSFDCKYLILLIISTVISQSFRAFCFKQLIHKTVPCTKMSYLIPICLTGSGLNIVLPARAGDIFRAYFTGEKYNCSRMQIFGSVMLERLFDVITIFCILALGIFVYQRNPLAIQLCLFAGILLIIGIITAIITYKYNKIDKIFDYIKTKTKCLPFPDFFNRSLTFLSNTCYSFFNGFEIIDSPKRIFYTLAASVGIWAFECLNYVIIIQGFGYNIHWSVSLFIISFIALACMIPSTSIFIGPYQVAVIAAFSIYGIPKETALAISIVEQTGVAIFFAIFAFMFLLKNNISYSKLKEDIAEKT